MSAVGGGQLREFAGGLRQTGAMIDQHSAVVHAPQPSASVGDLNGVGILAQAQCDYPARRGEFGDRLMRGVASSRQAL
ncbi:hypothetical protein O3Q52_06785 [Streptomyces sp. ActVer]|nr:hypothetical protein [Streptomyces sp. ActVer]MCZ4507909.1 hypothetical protein [Streptomyces sp. ActVer]